MLGKLYRMRRECPECGSADVVRSRRHGLLESALKLVVRLRPYRCRECFHRFFGYVNAELRPHQEKKAA